MRQSRITNMRVQSEKREGSANEGIIIFGNQHMITDKPHLKQYFLPNRNFLYSIRVVGTTEYHSILDASTYKIVKFEDPRTNELLDAFSFSVYHPRRDNISLYAQQLARRKYAARVNYEIQNRQATGS